MTSSDWIALGALAVAVVSWIDSLRRINNSAVAFQVEYNEESKGWYRIRNIGTRSAGWATLDLASLAEFEVGGMATAPSMVPGAALNFSLRSSRAELPDSVVVKYGGNRLTRSRRVPFHPVRVAADGSPWE
jgi:hypothetical protein